jgi:hypothetical protein
VEPEVDDADCVTIRVRFIDETQFEVRSPLTATLAQVPILPKIIFKLVYVKYVQKILFHANKSNKIRKTRKRMRKRYF